MTARDREHDKWIPWYVDDTPGWLELSLAARGAMEGIARKLNDKTGKIVLRRGISSLALLLHVRWEELEPALAELIARGKIAWDGSTFTLADPDYAERRRRSGADRVADFRARKKADVTPVTLPALPPLPALHVTDVTPVLVSSDLISSGSGSQIASAPDWWQPTLDTLEANTGVQLPAGEAWLRYAGHRASKEPPKPTSPPDALHWLGTVMVREHRDARDAAHHRDKRDRDFDSKRRFAKDGPERPQPTAAQSKAMADELARRLLGRKVGT